MFTFILNESAGRWYIQCVFLNYHFAAVAYRTFNEAARLLSAIRECCRTSQKAVDTLVSGIHDAFKLYHDFLKVSMFVATFTYYL